MDDLNKLFAELKQTGDWQQIYTPLKEAARRIAGDSHHEDVFHDVLASMLGKLDSIAHVGYVLRSIQFHAQKLRVRKKKYDQRLQKIWRNEGYDEYR